MRTVGIRELKSRLSEYLRRVQAGETFLAMAEKEGARLGRGNRGSGYPVLARLAPDGTAEELLDEERVSA